MNEWIQWLIKEIITFENEYMAEQKNELMNQK